MEELAPAPAQRTSDNGGRGPAEEAFSARTKVPKKVRPVPAPEPTTEAKVESEHQLDVLA
jgi:hypothetical protein